MTDAYLFVYLFIYTNVFKFRRRLTLPMYIYLSVCNALPMIPLSQVKVSYIPRFGAYVLSGGPLIFPFSFFFLT